MGRRFYGVAGTLTILILCLVPSVLLADDWPQWRGPRRDGSWQEKGIVASLPGPIMPLKWSAEISNGYSGPCVAGGRVFLMDRLTKPNPVERVLCFDAETGQKVWSYEYPCAYESISFPAGPRSTPSWDQGRLYTLGAAGHLHCLNVADGKVIWAKDLKETHLIVMPPWGISTSPLVEGEMVIVQIGGKDNAGVVAFEKLTGKEIWRSLPDAPTSYASPIVVDWGKQRGLVCWTDKRVAGLDLKTGQPLFEIPFASSKDAVNIASPVYADGALFVSGFWDGAMMIVMSPGDDGSQPPTVLWKRKGKSEVETDALHCCISTPMLKNGYVYGVDSYGQLRCLHGGTGDRVWENLNAVPPGRWANIHMVQNGELTWMFNEAGALIIARLSPKGYEEISRSKLMDLPKEALDKRGGVCWSHPAFAYKRVYARNDRELVCADLAAGGAGE